MNTKNSIIRDLQLEAADEDISVVTLLRKAKIIATKLDLNEFLEWIDKELKGYTGHSEELPEYRKVYGEPKALNPYHGWQPIFFPSAKVREAYSLVPIGQAIGSLEELVKQDRVNPAGSLQFRYPPELKQRIIDSLEFPADVKITLSIGSAHGILEIVRNSILEWALNLEKAGITGEGLSFTKNDKDQAGSITQTIYAQNISHVGNVYDEAVVINNNNMGLDLGVIKDIVSQIEKAIQLLPDNSKSEIEVQIKNVKVELENDNELKNTSKISGALKSIKTICEGITGNVVAQGIVSSLSALL